MKTSLITMFRVWRLFNLWSSPEPGFVSSSYFNLIAIPTRHWPLIGPLTPDWPLIGQQFPEELDFNLIAQSTSSLLLLDPDRGHNGAKTPIWFFSPAPIPPLPRSLKRQLFHQRVLVPSHSINIIPSLYTLHVPSTERWRSGHGILLLLSVIIPQPRDLCWQTVPGQKPLNDPNWISNDPEKLMARFFDLTVLCLIKLCFRLGSWQ